VFGWPNGRALFNIDANLHPLHSEISMVRGLNAKASAKAWLAGIALSLSFPLLAHADGEQASGDPAVGQKKFYTCYGCHGIPNYKNAYPDYAVPMLRHQNAAYIVSALQEYRSGDRPHATMHAQAASLSDQDMADIAAYLQGAEALKPTASVVGTAPPQFAPCVACHGSNGQGIAAPMNPKPPILAGQHVDYLEQALASYHNGRRKNAVMDSMAQLLKTDEDIKIVAAYLASQQSPLVTATETSK
jgi:cytochrome c553